MKNRDYRNQELKHKIIARKNSGYNELIWTLDPKQVHFIKEVMTLRVEEHSYVVETKEIDDPKNVPMILKRIHYARTRGGKKSIITKLSHSDKKNLKEYGINFKPYKFKIYL